MAARAVPAPLAAIPNLLTIGRLILIPVFVVLLLVSDGGHSWPAAIVFGVAGVTDQIDGWLARRWHVESEFGKIADPLADRLMIDAAVLLRWHAGRTLPRRLPREGKARGRGGVKAVVMAGGEGTRLRPLTSNQPKPMVPVVGKPCMEHIVELLRGHGMEDVIVTVAFLPQAIRSYF